MISGELSNSPHGVCIVSNFQLRNFVAQRQLAPSEYLADVRRFYVRERITTNDPQNGIGGRVEAFRVLEVSSESPRIYDSALQSLFYYRIGLYSSFYSLPHICHN